jgi:hypothetical protein
VKRVVLRQHCFSPLCPLVLLPYQGLQIGI